MIQEIRTLYDKYKEELKEVRNTQKQRALTLSPHFDDIEAELLYMFVREYQPEHMIEFSPMG